MFRKVSMVSDNTNIILVFGSTGGGAQPYKSGRRVSGLLSEFCTVQVLHVQEVNLQGLIPASFSH